MDTFDKLQPIGLKNDIQVEIASQEVIKVMVEAYLDALDIDNAAYDDFLNVFKLCVHKTHLDKLALLEANGVSAKVVGAISNQLDQYDALVTEFEIGQWRSGHTSPVSDKAMMALSIKKSSIAKDPKLTEFVGSYFKLLKQLVINKQMTQAEVREHYIQAFGDSGFPKFITAKTLANSLYIIRPDVFTLINDYVLEGLKESLGHKIKLTPDGYIDALSGFDKILSEITSTNHFGVLDRVVAYQIEHAMELSEVIDGVKDQDNVISQLITTPRVSPLNVILYGPPGTGKTYHTVTKAIQILDPQCYAENHANPDKDAGRKVMKERFDELLNEERVMMTTFHQSFSYEDFVEGIGAEAYQGEDGKSHGISYDVKDGIFKTICDSARSKETIDLDIAINLEGRKVWKMSLGDTQNSDDDFVYTECLQNNYVLLGWGGKLDFSDKKTKSSIRQAHLEVSTEPHPVNMIHRFINKMSTNDLIVVSDGNKKFRAIAEITGEYQYLSDKASERGDYLQKRSVRWLKSYTSSKPVNQLQDKLFSQTTLHRLSSPINSGKLEKLLQPKKQLELGTDSEPPHVLIIDEINRGNISRIFGELITLLEPSKREGEEDQQKVKLPYSKQLFSVPSNLYVIGTMNTADRSLAQIDIALRRRFKFEEMLPNPELLADIEIEGINVGKLLQVINERIEILLGRDYMLGHSYLMPLKKTPSLVMMAQVFKQEIIPLLQEYFFEDWEKIRLVLNDHQKTEKCYQFIVKGGAGNSVSVLFGNDVDEQADRRYFINADAFEETESFAQIIPSNAE